MNETLLNSDHLEVFYNLKFQYLHLIWKKTADLEEYQRSFIELTEFARNHPVNTFLADISRLTVLKPENRKWFEHEILPIAIDEFKLKRAAIRISKTEAQKKYAHYIKEASNAHNFYLKIFYSERKALKWLKLSPNKHILF